MNSDFPRIITLLRKERAISQKNASSDLGISQALLSHYEKGIRECGLAFLVRLADYYNVSCDYLLGRSPEPAGKKIYYEDIPEHDPHKKETLVASGIMASFNRKLLINSTTVLYSLAQKTGSGSLMKEMSAYLMLSVYKMFRIIYSANAKNDQRFFTVHEAVCSNMSDAAMSICEANAKAAAGGVAIGGGDTVKESADTIITTNSLSDEYAALSSSLLNIIKNSEARIQMIVPTEK
ncbi:MAG: helix-turn-helix domain-containing protein [Oscillospiraceae bacterium]|nr:helix-turn-helix domain-containing protein [Oscillospiraceae bacterium]